MPVLDLTDVRRHIGKEIHIPQMLDPVEKLEIRRYVLAVFGDNNPLWLDDEYAKRTRWGGLIAPPTFLRMHPFSGYEPGVPFFDVGEIPGLPRWGLLWGGGDWEFFKPLRPGDIIEYHAALDRVEEKQGGHAKSMVLCIGTQTYADPKAGGQPYAKFDHIIARFKGEENERWGRYGKPGDFPDNYSTDRPPFWQEPEVRGATPRYYDDVAIGDEITPLVRGPLCTQEVVAAEQAHRVRYFPGDWVFTWSDRPRRNFWHWTPIISWGWRGIPNVYDYGAIREGWLCQMVTNWMGDDGWLWKFGFRLRRPNFACDTTLCQGKVVGKSVNKEGKGVLDLELWGETARSGVIVTGTASVVLPSRGT